MAALLCQLLLRGDVRNNAKPTASNGFNMIISPFMVVKLCYHAHLKKILNVLCI